MCSLDDIAVVVPVREGSSRIKDNAPLPFAPQFTVLEWKLRQLREVLPPSQIYVSTDSDTLKGVAQRCGVQIHHRQPYLCRGHLAPLPEVITGIAQEIPFEHLAWATVVVPLMSPQEYLGAFRTYLERVVRTAEFDSLFAVNTLKEYLWYADRPANYPGDRHHPEPADLPSLFRVTNGLFVRSRQAMLQDAYYLGPKPCRFVVSRLAGLCVDVLEEYHAARTVTQFCPSALVHEVAPSLVAA